MADVYWVGVFVGLGVGVGVLFAGLLGALRWGLIGATVLGAVVGLGLGLLLGDIEGCHVGPFDSDRWTDALRPHLDAPDPRVQGRRRAGWFSASLMARRVLEA